MEYEYYEDVIDAYEAGIGVEEGDSLTDYIRKNNIKIINIEPFRPTESKADGGSVGIEILFGPKRDNFRYGGDTMGGKNDKSKSSPGPDSSKVSAQQQSNHQQAMAAAQGGGGGVNNFINNINKTNFLDKVKNKVDMVVDNPLTKFLDPRSKIALAMGGYKFLRDGIPKLEDFENEAINQELENIQTKGGIVPYANGGRVGFFMGGPALEGQALAIYNSMKDYGATDQAIADRLGSMGLYDPNASTPDTPDTPDQGIINQQLNQGGGDGPKGDFGIFGNLLKDTEKTFTKDMYTIDKNMYPGAPMTGSFKPTEVTGYKNVNTGLYQTEAGKNINHLGLNIKPGIISLLEKLGFGGLDETQFTGLPYKEGYIAGTFTGKKLSDFNPFNFKIKNPFNFFKNQQATNAEIAAANLKAKQELEAKLAAEAAAAALQQQMQNTGVTGSNYNQAANIAGGGGGNTATYGGQTAREATYDNDPSTGTSQGYSQHYARGGLATMFTRRR